MLPFDLVALVAAAAASVAPAGSASDAPFPWPTPIVTAAPAPQPTVLWNGPPASSFAVEATPLGVSADGVAQALVRVVLRDAEGRVTHLRRGADFDYSADRGTVQWQTRMRYGGPAAIVSERDEGAVTVRVKANRPAGLGVQSVRFDTRRWPLPHVVATAVGPHLVRVGWFPRASGPVAIDRLDASGQIAARGRVGPALSSWDDRHVAPGTRVRYRVVRPGMPAIDVAVDVPAELPVTTVDTIRGKSAWLLFSPDPLDDMSYTKLDVDAIVATAVRAGLRSVELRLAYGAFNEAQPGAKATIDRLIDRLSSHGVRVIGWSVPRADAIDDLAENVAIAGYRTPAGSEISGLAVDLERGEEFMGDGPEGLRGLRSYLAHLREAVGPHVLLVATIEDPFLEHLDQVKFPYHEIARDADVLQPMTYWRMMGPWDSDEKARAAVGGSIALVRRLAGRDVPIDLGAQTTPLSKRGAPPPSELAAAVDAARADGAIGVTFYDWSGTAPNQWAAIAAAAW